MVSTRLAPAPGPLGLASPPRRDRVDPRKLLGLIHRIKSAAGAAATPLPAPKPDPAAKAG